MRLLVVSADRSTEGGAPHNLGDAFLTDVLLAELQTRGHDAVAVDFGGVRTSGSAPRTRRSGVRGLWRAIRAADAVIVGGGTLLQDDSDSRWRGLPRLCAVTSLLAWISSRPLAYFGVGCDPVARFIPRRMLRFAVWRRRLWIRDVDSLARVRRDLRGDAVLAADACLLPAADHLLDQGEPSEAAGSADHLGEVLALNFSDSSRLHADFFVNSAHGNEAPRFIEMSNGQGIADRTPELEAISDGRLEFPHLTDGWRSAAAEISASDSVYASRMHALYLAMLLTRRMVAIGVGAKIASFAREFEIPLCEELDSGVRGHPALANPLQLAKARRRAEDGLSDLLEILATRSRTTRR